MRVIQIFAYRDELYALTDNGHIWRLVGELSDPDHFWSIVDALPVFTMCR